MKPLKCFLFCFTMLMIKKGDSESWKCKDGLEIDSDWKCDGQIDCLDQSDESLQSCGLRGCQFHEFLCDSGLCIPFELVCNGEADCSIAGIEDDSDETLDCDAVTQRRAVFYCNSTFQFECPSGACIPREWLCDNMDDCGDNADEKECGLDCPPQHVLCNSSINCIDQSWVCDGYNDCGNFEDERHCKVKQIANEMVKGCNIDEFYCGKLCLTIDKACDGIWDCEKGEDEGEHCFLDECRSRNDPSTWEIRNGRPLCDHECRQTPQGPMCYCYPNYRLEEPDGIQCREKGSVPTRLLFSNRNEVRSITLSTLSPVERVLFHDSINPDALISSLDFDVHSDELLWIDKFHCSVHVLNTLNYEIEIIEIKGAKELVLDWITRNVYLIIETKDNERIIKVFNLNQIITALNNMDDIIPLMFDLKIAPINPLAIALHPNLGKMFLIDKDERNNRSRLIVTDMDGSNVTTFADAPDKTEMYAVTIDYTTDIVYWSEVNETMSNIKYRKLNGNGTVKNLISIVGEKLHFAPKTISVFEGKLYFCGYKSHEIWAVDSITGKSINFIKHEPVPFLKTGVESDITLLRVYNPVFQDKKEGNPCQLSQCSHLCVLSPLGVRCLCPHSMILDNNNKTCFDPTFSVKANSTVPKNNNTKLDNLAPIPSSPSSIKNPENVTTTKKRKCLLPSILNLSGKVLYFGNSTSFEVGTKIIYACKDGWYIKGFPNLKNITLTCKENMEWDTSLPSCIQHNCSTFNFEAQEFCYTNETGSFCKCFNGHVEPSSRATYDIQPTFVKITLGLIVFLISAATGFLFWWKRQSNKRAQTQREELIPSPVYFPLGDSENETDNIKIDLKVSDEMTQSLITNHEMSQKHSSSSEDIDSVMDRSSSSLSSSSGGIYNYNILKESCDLDVEKSFEETR